MKHFIIIFISVLSTTNIYSQDLSQIYEKVNPAVVVLYTTEKSIKLEKNNTTKMIREEGLGSGFMISDRLLITAAHVVGVSETINVMFLDGDNIPATVVTSYNTADIALVKLLRPKIGANFVKLGDSDLLKIGEQIMVVGAPFGLSSSLSSGYVSGFRKGNMSKNPFTSSEFIQTDAAINQGNSGGPMFNLNGEVVGIVSHITTKSGGFEGIGYATSSNLAKRLLLDSKLPWFGAEFHTLTNKESMLLNLPQKNGLLVQRIASTSVLGKMGVKGGDTPAVIGDKSLILGGDIILSFNNIPFEMTDASIDKLAEFAKNLEKSPKFELTVLRNGKILTLKN